MSEREQLQAKLTSLSDRMHTIELDLQRLAFAYLVGQDGTAYPFYRDQLTNYEALQRELYMVNFALGFLEQPEETQESAQDLGEEN